MGNKHMPGLFFALNPVICALNSQHHTCVPMENNRVQENYASMLREQV